MSSKSLGIANKLLIRGKYGISNSVKLRQFHVSSCCKLFHESHPRGEYRKADDEKIFSHVKKGWKELGKECKLFLEEIKEKFNNDPILAYYPGVYI